MMQEALRVCTLQADLLWKSVESNLAAFSKKLDEVGQKVDLYVLPEMFSTGFCMQPEEVSASSGKKSLAWLIDQAKQREAGFCASVLFRLEDGRFVNRMFLVEQDGSYSHYDKRHRFALAGEHEAYAEGDSQPVISTFRGWKILLQVCYDLRFPVFSRNTVNGYDAVIYVANWPQTRRHHWRTLLTARAIENQAYCIGVNRVGKDGNDLLYVGDSMIVDPLGTTLLELNDSVSFGIAEITKSSLSDLRARLPFLLDADRFKLYD
jgi:predicted amidohydrolase